jgi:iron complex outermembrane receptor protein
LGASTPDELGFDYRRSYFYKDLSEQSRNTNFFAQMDYKISGQWKSQTNFSSVNSFSDGFGPYFYLLPNDSLSREDQSTRNSKYSVTEIQENINGDFKIGNMRNRVVVGLDFMRINSNQYFYYGAFDQVSATSGLDFNYDSFNKDALNAARANGTAGNYLYPSIYKTNTYSAYVSDALNITDQLIALAGLRVDNFHNEGNFDPTTSKTSGAYNQTAFSPKFGLVYQPIKDQISIFANYQNGFKNQTGVSFSGSTFKPEHANQVEGGVKFDLLSGKLSSTLSYYSIQVKDILRTDPEHPQSQIQNGTQNSKGVEGEIIANPVPGFNFVAGFAYNDSKYIHADGDVNGLRPSTAMSPFSANVWASYRFQQGKIKGLGLGFGGNYASDNKVVNSVSQGVFTLPAYTVFNSTVFYDKSVYRIGLTVNNLTNREYYIGYTTINPQMLRQVLASFTFRF